MSWIGEPVRRVEDPPLLRGQGVYAADPRPPGLAWIAIRRAGVPRARGLRVELAAARSLPGVLGAWRAGDLDLADDHMPDPAPLEPPVRRPLLARDEVRYEGDAVAVVAAESDYLAHDALDAVDVDFDEVGGGWPPASRAECGFGDAAAAFAEGVVVREELKMARICGAALEPRAVTAEWDDAEQRLTVRATVGWVHSLRDTLASCLGLRKEQVVVLTEDVGGSFGAKNHPFPEYVLAAAVSRQLKRPVRWVASRSEDGQTTAQSHGVDLQLEIAAGGDGQLRGLRARVRWSAGAYLTRGAGQGQIMAAHMTSLYRLPALRVEVETGYSSTPPSGFIRGGGRPVGNFATERMLDRLARRLALDPLELRRRNLIPPEAMPYPTGLGGITYDGGDFPRLLEAAAERADVGAVRARQRAGEPLGLGVALCAESTGIGMPEPTRVHVSAEGTATVYTGGTPQGQGHRTFLAQVAAERLGWPLDRIEVRTGDSRHVPFSAVTAGSRSALELGNSVAISAAAARRRLLERASELLEAAPEDIQLGPDGVRVRGVPQSSARLAQVVGDGLEASGTWDSQGAMAWSSSCHVAVVRLDRDSGAVAMQRYLIAHDSGRAINPMLVDGQLHGGYAHGLGYALFEEATYSADGFFTAPSFLDYTIPSAPELACEPELIHCQTASTQNPEGFRGVGEAGTIAVPAAVANAVEDALYALGREVCVDAVPVTPERVWRWLNPG
jgi:carbon-monoxide dehydrogenase large subunit